jgi:hypothetical protein
MNFKKIAIATGLLTAFMSPGISQAAESTLSGWGSAFAKAYSEAQGTSLSGEGHGQAAGMINLQKPAAKAPMTQPSTPKSPEAIDNAKESMASGQAKAEATAKATAEVGIKFSAEQKNSAFDRADQAYAKVGDAAEQVTGKISGVLTQVGDMGAQGASLRHENNIAGNLNVANMVTGSLTASTAATAQLAGVSQLATVATLTSSLLSNVLASRPTTLTGLLR